MPPTNRRAGAAVDIAALDALTAPATGRLRKSPAADPVLGQAAPQLQPQVDPDRERPEPDRRRRRSNPNPAPAAAGPNAKTKVGFYQLAENTERARGAFEYTRAVEGHATLSEFIAAAVMREVERLEREYNHGKPWPPLRAGTIATGNPDRR